MKTIPFVIRAGGQYWGSNPVTGRPDWTWAPTAAARFPTVQDAHNAMLAVCVAAGSVPGAPEGLTPGAIIEVDTGRSRPGVEVKSPEYEVVPDPTGSKW